MKRAMVDTARGHLQAFVRAFGLLADDTTPCGQPVSVREAHALLLVLHAARSGSSVCQRDLQGALGVDKSNVSRLVERLQASGWIVQVRSPRDRRVRELSLTAAGRRNAERLDAASHAHVARLLAHIPPARRADAVETLALLEEAARALHVVPPTVHDARPRARARGVRRGT